MLTSAVDYWNIPAVNNINAKLYGVLLVWNGQLLRCPRSPSPLSRRSTGPRTVVSVWSTCANQTPTTQPRLLLPTVPSADHSSNTSAAPAARWNLAASWSCWLVPTKASVSSCWRYVPYRITHMSQSMQNFASIISSLIILCVLFLIGGRLGFG